MPSATPDWLHENELHLARLCCAKLTGILQGTISIGLPALICGKPDPQVFLPEQFDVMDAHVVAMSKISGNMRTPEAFWRLRECAGTLRDELRRLQHEIDSVQLTSISPPNGVFDRVRDAIVRVCDQLAIYADLIGEDGSSIADAKHVALDIVEAMPELLHSTSKQLIAQ
jgi:hypothetical protein